MAKINVFVTGGTGFVGSYILRYLIRGNYRVKALRRSTSSMDLVSDILDKVEWVEGDILDLPFLEDQLIGINHVYHAAAVVSTNYKERTHMVKVNVEGTANIVNASLYRGVDKFIHLSSAAVFGKKEFQFSIDENSHWENSRHNSSYAISKFKAECQVWRGMQEGLCANIINPTVIIGAGLWSSGSCKVFKNVLNGLKYYPQGGSGFIDVRDVARTAISLMESDIAGERYVLNAENYSYKDLIFMVSSALGKVPPQKKENPFFRAFFSILERLCLRLFRNTPAFTKNSFKTSNSTYCYINKKILSALDTEFISIQETVEETATVFLDCQKVKSEYGVFSI